MELELFTTFGNSWQDKFHQTVVFRRDPGIENQAVNLYPDIAYRTLEGVGGAITDSAAYVYSLMDDAQKKELMQSYFTQEGMTAFYDWNLLLDEKGGPNYAENYCLAPYLYDTSRMKLMPQLLQKHIAHFSHYLLPGSVQIGCSRYTEQIDVTAWKRPDGRIAVVLLNKSEQIMPVCLRMEGFVAECLLYPQSITTGIIRDQT